MLPDAGLSVFLHARYERPVGCSLHVIFRMPWMLIFTDWSIRFGGHVSKNLENENIFIVFDFDFGSCQNTPFYGDLVFPVHGGIKKKYMT